MAAKAASTAARSMRGVLAPVLTPFKAGTLEPDVKRFLTHCRWLLDKKVGLAIFGTNSEANSLGVREKMLLMDELVHTVKAPAHRLMPGTGTCSLPETVELTKHATALGVGGVLMLPPFYYKNVSDEGLFRYFSEVIERVGDDRLRIYLYHFPALSQVPLSPSLIRRLVDKYPTAVAGVKDSSGVWDYSRTLIEDLGPRGFEVFAGSEALLLQTLRAGGAGCISATVNVQPGPIYKLFATWQQADADAQQASLQTIRSLFQSFPLIPAMKAALDHYAEDGWEVLRPPLVPLAPDARKSLLTQLEETGFRIDDWGKV